MLPGCLTEWRCDAGHSEPSGCHSPWGTVSGPAMSRGEGLALGTGRTGLLHFPCPGVGCPGQSL